MIEKQRRILTEPIIEIVDVSKIYSPNIKALEKVSFSIEGGEFVILVGPSGAGKSTLVRLLIREELPTAGKIIISGRDITRLKSKELPYYRRNVGIVFQDYKLLPQKTVGENIAFALEVSGVPDEEIKKRVAKILEMVGLSQRTNNYPDELSGGEKQRATIARALVMSPKLLIADEPTGNLDPENTADVIELLERVNSGGTIVLLATHNREIVNQLRKRVVSIREGKVVSDVKKGRYIV